MSFSRNSPARFGAYLRNARLDRNVRGCELAQRVGISPQYLSDIELGYRPPPDEARVLSFAIVLGIDSWELIRKAGRLPEELVDSLLLLSVEEWRELCGNIETAKALEDSP